MRGGSWNARDRLNDRIRACRWRFDPSTYKVRADDTREQAALRMASDCIGGSVPEFFLWCARYVLQHHKRLKGVRARLRKLDREERVNERERVKREAAQRKAAEALWDGLRK